MGWSVPSRANIYDLRFEHPGREAGLSQARVYCIHQDQRGFLWFGTFDDGLFRYDGYTFRRFSHDPEDPSSLSSDSISAIADGPNGDLWIGTAGGGLNRFRLQTEVFERFQHDDENADSLSHDDVSTILVDSSGGTWVGTYGGGLNRLVLDEHGTRFVNYRHDPDDPDSLGGDTIWNLVEDSQGKLWVGLRHFGLDYCDLPEAGRNIAFRHLRHDSKDPTSLSTDQIWSLEAGADDALWIGTFDNGLHRFDPDRQAFTSYRAKDGGPSSDQIRVLYEGSGGVLWIGTRSGGLNRFDPQSGTFAEYRHVASDPESLSHDHIVSILEDAEGVLWVGTWGGGINKVDPRTAQFGRHRHHEDDPHSLISDRVYAILEDSAGALWIGTEKGLDRRTSPIGDRPAFSHHLTKSNAPVLDDYISVLFEDRDGNLWLDASHSGLYSLPASEKGEKQPRFVSYRNRPNHPLSRITDHCLSIGQDHDGALWFGTYNEGLYRWDGRELTSFRSSPDDPSSLSHDLVWTIVFDSSGELWVGTYGGLNRFNPRNQTFDRFLHNDDDPDSLSRDNVWSLAEQSDGTLWIGTAGGGLNRLDRQKQRFTHYREKDGLASDSIIEILVDDSDRLWLATNRGLDRFDPITGTVTHHFGRQDGLQGESFTGTDGAAFKGRDGHLYFGGVNGFNAFLPNRIESNSRVPPVVVTDFLLSNKPAPISDTSPINLSIGFVDEIVLDHTDSLFAFEFAALSFRRPERNRYAYMMEGLDKDWIETDARDRKAVYTSIPPGSYTFRVRASNDDGLWNETGRAIRVTITPPWWQTWWARLGFVLGLALGLFTWHRVRTSRLRSIALVLEGKVAERTREVEEARRKAESASKAKSTFLANMSHELRTPLNAIIGFAQIMAGSHDIPEKEKKNLRTIRRSGEHLLTLINQVLDLSKIEAGRITLNERDFDLRQLLIELEEMFRWDAEDKGLQLKLDLAASVPRYVRTDDVKLKSVLINLVNNAIKFTEDGAITLRVAGLPQPVGGNPSTELRFEIEDTGPGIASSEMDEIFEAFRQTETGRKAREGTGLGLAISHGFVERMGGTIQVTSEEGIGTIFSFELPVVIVDLTPRRAKESGMVTKLGSSGSEDERRTTKIDDLKDMLSEVPADLLARLGKTAKTGSMAEMDTLIGEVRVHSPSLADGLAILADDFAYDKILQLLQTSVE